MLDLDTCKRLEAAGFPQHTVTKINEINRREDIACPSFDEIWLDLDRKGIVGKITIAGNMITYLHYDEDKETEEHRWLLLPTPTSGVARMWLWLKEEEII